MPFSPDSMDDILRIANFFFGNEARNYIYNKTAYSFNLPISEHIQQQYQGNIENVSVHRRAGHDSYARVHMTHKKAPPVTFQFLEESEFMDILQQLYPNVSDLQKEGEARQTRLENERAEKQHTLQIENGIKSFVRDLEKDICDNALSRALDECKTRGEQNKHWKEYATLYKDELRSIIANKILSYDSLSRLQSRLDRFSAYGS
jgi:hypothetical protein